MEISIPPLASAQPVESSSTPTEPSNAISKRSLLSNQAHVKLWRGFELLLSQVPKSSHGRIILPWDQEIRDFNARKVKCLAPPNLKMSDVNTLIGDLRLLPLYKPDKIGESWCLWVVGTLALLIPLLCLTIAFLKNIK
jgi:hypothetical protein